MDMLLLYCGKDMLAMARLCSRAIEEKKSPKPDGLGLFLAFRPAMAHKFRFEALAIITDMRFLIFASIGIKMR
jgi:hypothetical protein